MSSDADVSFHVSRVLCWRSETPLASATSVPRGLFESTLDIGLMTSTIRLLLIPPFLQRPPQPLWISGSTDADLEEVEKYVYYVDGARKALEKQVACEEMMTVAAGAYSCPLFSSK